MGYWIYAFTGLPSHPYFVSAIQLFYLGCDYYIWNRLEALETMLLPLGFKNWFGSFHFHNYLKWDDFCHYESKLKIQKVKWNVFRAEIRIHFHFQLKRYSSCAYVLLSVYTPLPVRTLYRRPLSLYMM